MPRWWFLFAPDPHFVAVFQVNRRPPAPAQVCHAPGPWKRLVSVLFGCWRGISSPPPKNRPLLPLVPLGSASEATVAIILFFPLAAPGFGYRVQFVWISLRSVPTINKSSYAFPQTHFFNDWNHASPPHCSVAFFLDLSNHWSLRPHIHTTVSIENSPKQFWSR